MLLRNERIRLRALSRTDLPLLERWENDTSLWLYGSMVAPFNQDLLNEFLSSYTGDIYAQKQLRFIVELTQHDHLSIGAVDLYDFDPFNSRVAVGILIDRQWQGKGFAKECIETVTEYALSYLGLKQCYAIVATNNEISRRLFSSCGYTQSAVLKSWFRQGFRYVDAIYYQRLSPANYPN